MADFYSSMRIVWKTVFFRIVLVLLVLMAITVFMSGFFSGRQPATVALDVGISIVRLVLPFFIVMLVHELFGREFERRLYLNSLTYPRGRGGFLCSRFVTVLIVLIFVASLLFLLVGILVWLISGWYEQSTKVDLGVGYLVVAGFVLLDALVVSSFALLLSVYASSSSFVLFSTLGFVISSRSFGSIVEMLERDSSLGFGVEGYSVGLELLHCLLPDLGALDVRMIALYGSFEFFPDDWAMIVLNCLSYTLLLLLISVAILRRKRFE
ncbi:hypothetical protein WG219_17455 [Ectopseudomonas mendocina]|uniref:ABC transporter permease n=1 Tax=Ectopseudomonas mendocina TaxID=300 RepID=A0ABZ2REN2_ECTME